MDLAQRKQSIDIDTVSVFTIHPGMHDKTN